jgi:hypothetical protein
MAKFVWLKLIAHDQHDFFSNYSPDSFVTAIFVMSSAAVGWIPIVESSTYLVNPIFIATANPCITSPAFGPA